MERKEKSPVDTKVGGEGRGNITGFSAKQVEDERTGNKQYQERRKRIEEKVKG